MKIVIGLVVVALLGGIGYGVYRWTDAPEQLEEWMSEQDLKNFPTQAKRELKSMREDLDKRKTTKKELDRDVMIREGMDGHEDVVKNNLKTVKAYETEKEKFGKAITDIVTQVKKQKENLVAAGTVDAATGEIPVDHKYSITSTSGKTLDWTWATAKKNTDEMALKIKTIDRKVALQNRIISKKKEASKKLGELIVKMEYKIEEMDAFIQEMEVEMEILDLEKDIAEINDSINGDGDTSKFGDAIRKFKLKQAEFAADQKLTSSAEPSEGDYFDESDTPTEAGASDSYWN